MEEMNRHCVGEGCSLVSLEAQQIKKISKFMMDLILVKTLLIDAEVTGACAGNVCNSSSASGGAGKEIKILQMCLVKTSVIWTPETSGSGR